MKNIFKLIAIAALALFAAACSNKAEYKVVSYVTFNAKRAMIPEACGVYAIPVSVHNAQPGCVVTYKVTEGSAKAGVDYVVVDKSGVEDKSGVLNITSDVDTIYLKITDRTGELTKNLSFTMTLVDSATDGIYLGATSVLACTIIDSDAGINLLGGSWSGKGKDTDGESVDLSFDIAILDTSAPESAEILEAYPNCNLVFENLTPADMTSQGDIYGFYDDNTAKVHIYSNQFFNAYNFTNLGPMYVGLATNSHSDTDDITLSVDDEVLVLDQDMYIYLYNYDEEAAFSGYYYMAFASGFEMQKLD